MDLFLIVTVSLPIIPFLLGIYKIKRLNKPFLFLLLMITFETIISFYSFWQYTNKANNIPSIYLLTLVEVIFGGYFMLSSVSKKQYKLIIASLILISVSHTIYVSLIAGNIRTHNPLNRSLQGYFMVVFALLYFYDLLKNKVAINLKHEPSFWIATAFFLFFGTTQFLYLFNDFIQAYDPAIQKFFWKFHYIFSNTYYILLTIGLWKKK